MGHIQGFQTFLHPLKSTGYSKSTGLPLGESPATAGSSDTVWPLHKHSSRRPTGFGPALSPAGPDSTPEASIPRPVEFQCPCGTNPSLFPQIELFRHEDEGTFPLAGALPLQTGSLRKAPGLE